MKRRIALIAAFAAVLGLSACGGSDDDSSSTTKVYDVAALSKTDTVVGTGAEAVATSTVTVNYTLWLYDSTKSDLKGTRIEGPSTLTRALAELIAGWQQGVVGMKVGGKRTLLVPSTLGYGSAGSGAIPGNSGLVFDIELTASTAPVIATVYNVAALTKTDTLVGTGAEALANSIATTTYSLWLYDATKADFKGTKIEGPAAMTRSLAVLIPGWQQGVTGMKVGGKRTVLVPASLAYGATGFGAIPANSGLVFDIELTAVTPVYDAPALVKIDTLAGTGAEATAASTITATYSLWLYDATKADFKGTAVEGPAALTLSLSSLIPGWQQGVPGMKVGGKRTLVVPSSLGYGATPPKTTIPPNSGLVFDVELTAVR